MAGISISRLNLWGLLSLFKFTQNFSDRQSTPNIKVKKWHPDEETQWEALTVSHIYLRTQSINLCCTTFKSLPQMLTVRVKWHLCRLDLDLPVSVKMLVLFNISHFLEEIKSYSQSQWRHELSLPTQTLRSWVQIPVKAQMAVCSFLVLSCVCSSLAMCWCAIKGVMQTVYKIHKCRINFEWGQTKQHNLSRRKDLMKIDKLLFSILIQFIINMLICNFNFYLKKSSRIFYVSK
jgi:hypothetical protein